MMGELPKPRITPSRPFSHTGVDFTGHVDVKLNKGRGAKTTKAYIAIFVCMATKAVHIELVSDLSTDAFIAAFQRMYARRGTPAHVYSDNGTNFVGAAKSLTSEFQAFEKLLTSEFFTEISKLRVQWHFNAPAWPSAGGIYEAAVKSMKHHLRRVLGDQKLTWEEFTTLLAKIEACMNSRPLCALTENPEEFYNTLTPGHFLTGSPTLSLPQPNPEDRNLDLRKRWQLTEHMLEQFWKAWANYYLTTLQTRCKWQKPQKNLKEDDIVLIKEANLPPGKWAMGRVVEVHPGPDNLVRVVTLKTKTGLLKRPIVKLSPLPTADEANEDNLKRNNLDPKTKRLRPKSAARMNRNLFTLATLLTVLFNVITGSNCIETKAIRITKLEPERPLYYDEIGKINLIHDEWILLMYYNLTTYWQGTQQIKTYLTDMQELCGKMDPRYCQTITNQLSHEINLLDHYNEMLLVPHKHMSLRKRRGLINGIGSIANSLFGVLDNQIAEKYEQDIANIHDNENYLLELTKNQTTIIEMENALLQKNEENIKKQFNLIASYMQETNMTLARIENEVQVLMAVSYFSTSAVTAMLLLNNLKNIQELLLTAVTQVYQGRMDVHLLTPSTLGKQLDDIAGKLPKTLSLPVDDTRDLKELYDLLYVKARITESYMLYEMHIPLLCDEEFTLYKIIPLPVNYNNETRWLQTKTTHIAVNLRKNSYISVTTQDLKNCIQRNINSYTCNSFLPIYNLHNNNAPCEAKLISQDASSACEIRNSPCKDAWIKLHTLNSWLVTCCGDCLLRVICIDDDVTIPTISNSNLITLGQSCTVQSKDVTIYSYNLYKSNFKVNPSLEVPKLDTSVNKIVNLALSSMPEMVPTNELDQAELDQRISVQKQNENRSLNPLTTHDVHQFATMYTLVGIVLMDAVLWNVRKFCTPSCKKRETVEAVALHSVVAAAKPSHSDERSRGSPRHKILTKMPFPLE